MPGGSALAHHRVITPMLLVLIMAGVACVLVFVGLPLLAAWAVAHEDDALDPGDVD